MAWRNFKKAPSKKSPSRSWSEEEIKIIGWCMSNNIKIAISPDWEHELHSWQIEIKIKNGKWHVDPKRYNDEEVYDNLIKYYKYYYDKYNKQ